MGILVKITPTGAILCTHPEGYVVGWFIKSEDTNYINYSEMYT